MRGGAVARPHPAWKAKYTTNPLLVAIHPRNRYPRRATGVLPDMPALHYRDVTDDAWSVDVVDLPIRGKLNFTNVDRFARVLRAASTAGIRSVDASGLAIFDIAGLRALDPRP